MIRHIVLWKFLEEAAGNTRAENLQKAKQLLDGLSRTIPEILTLEVGIALTTSSTAYHLALNATFASAEALVRYQNHPDHHRVVEFLRTVHDGKAVVDYAHEPV
jgi:hypothetical protein